MKTTRRKFIKISSIAGATIPLINLESRANLFISPEDKIFSKSVLESNFFKPPQATKSACYWWWFNARVDKEGITKYREYSETKGEGTQELC
ncbi:MAG: hypothetical protein EOO20_19035 [Chryseobacterium sp.]|nr:MAG: hypothetical protein EOO20_19035 [Chryseobacterium sp.]